MGRARRVLVAVGAALGVALLALVVFLLLLIGRASSRIDSLNSADQARDQAIGVLASVDLGSLGTTKTNLTAVVGGTSAVAPPSRTAKRSSDTAPSTTFLPNTYSTPANTSRIVCALARRAVRARQRGLGARAPCAAFDARSPGARAFGVRGRSVSLPVA